MLSRRDLCKLALTAPAVRAFAKPDSKVAGVQIGVQSYSFRDRPLDAALQAMAKNPKLIYLIPEEGGTRAIDNLVIVKGAKHLAAAHQLINFLLSSEANVTFVTKVRGGPVLKTTRDQLPAELKNSKALFPDESQLSKLERIHDLGDQTGLYDQLWTELKTQ